MIGYFVAHSLSFRLLSSFTVYGQVTTFNQMANAYYGITFAEWNWVFMDAIWMITSKYKNAAIFLPSYRASR